MNDVLGSFIELGATNWAIQEHDHVAPYVNHLGCLLR